MKRRPRLVVILVGFILVTSLSTNLYQHYKIRSYKNELTDIVRNHIQSFAAYGGYVEDKAVYARKYANIVAAQEAYITLSDESVYSEVEWESTLFGLFVRLKQVMQTDEMKFKEAFLDTEGTELMWKISDNFEDHESITKLYQLLK